jgi:hypothetical protein
MYAHVLQYTLLTPVLDLIDVDGKFECIRSRTGVNGTYL